MVKKIWYNLFDSVLGSWILFPWIKFAIHVSIFTLLDKKVKY